MLFISPQHLLGIRLRRNETPMTGSDIVLGNPGHSEKNTNKCLIVISKCNY